MNYLNTSIEELHAFGKAKRQEYLEAAPFPNIYFDNFFNPAIISELLSEFPDFKKNTELKFEDPNQIKLASNGEYKFGEKSKRFAHFLNSQPFLEFLSYLTGIDSLIPDPYFEGGGFHQILPGGLLKIHADFNKSRITKLDRRLNVLVYLNEDWNEEWGGHFELWDQDMKGCVKKILPIFNRMAIFTTTDFSFHGHPDALKCPPDRSRKSLALYYYTNGRPEHEVVKGLEAHSTLFKARPDSNDKKLSLKEMVKQITPPIIFNAAKKLVG
ncbi:MAG TPA: 2OG-Fe(II) oxygenase [Cytophagales bacterium]|nr:2OG-Fe(II) oxygenase [Cytophagales bacterium]